jgi:hypothetical protein
LAKQYGSVAFHAEECGDFAAVHWPYAESPRSLLLRLLLGGKADPLCSERALPGVTHSGPPFKRPRLMVAIGQCGLFQPIQIRIFY